MLTPDPNHPLAKVGDTVAAGTIVGTFLGWLPTIAAVLSCIWFAIQISESATFKRFVVWVRTLFVRRATPADRTSPPA